MAKQKYYLSDKDYLKRLKEQVSIHPSDAKVYQPKLSEKQVMKRRISLRFILRTIILIFFMVSDLNITVETEKAEAFEDIESGMRLSISQKDGENGLIAQNTRVNPMITRLKDCEKHFKAKRLTTGKKGTALECYKRILKEHPDNIEAKIGLQKIEIIYVQWAKKALNNKNLKKARQYTEKVAKTNPESVYLSDLKKKIAALQKDIQKREGKGRKVKQTKKDYTTDELTEMSLGVEITDK